MTDDALELRRCVSVAKLLLELYAPRTALRAEACAALAEVLLLLTEPAPADD